MLTISILQLLQNIMPKLNKIENDISELKETRKC